MRRSHLRHTFRFVYGMSRSLNPPPYYIVSAPEYIHACLQEPSSPARCHTPLGIELVGDVLVGHAHRRQQDDPGAQLNARLHPFAIGQIAQTLIIFSTEQDGLGNSAQRKSSPSRHLWGHPKGRRSVSERCGRSCEINLSIRSFSVSSNLMATLRISLFERLWSS